MVFSPYIDMMYPVSGVETCASGPIADLHAAIYGCGAPKNATEVASEDVDGDTMISPSGYGLTAKGMMKYLGILIECEAHARRINDVFSPEDYGPTIFGSVGSAPTRLVPTRMPGLLHTYSHSKQRVEKSAAFQLLSF